MWTISADCPTMTPEELFNACIEFLTARQGRTLSEAYDIMSDGAAGDLFADLFPPKTVYVSEAEFRSIASTKNAPAVRMIQKAGGTEDSFSVVYRAWGRGPVIDMIHYFVPIF